MNKPLIAASLLLLASCASTVDVTRLGPDDGPGVDPSTAPALTFGESDDAASSDAGELFDRSPSNPNPKTLAGIYERTGYGSEQRPNSFLVVSNDWRTRLEIRAGSVVAGIECKMEVGGAVTEAKTLYAFASSPITVESWGIRISQPKKDTETWPDYDLECSVEIPDETWPYCLGPSNTVPEGYSMCVFINRGVELSVMKVDGSVGSMGKKVRN